MTKLIRTKQGALYFAGVPIILYMLLSAVLPIFFGGHSWLLTGVILVICCWPCAVAVGARCLNDQLARQGKTALLIPGLIGVCIAAVIAGIPLYIANLICLFQGKYPIDSLSRLRIRPLLYAVGAAMLLTGLLETFLAML